MKIHPLADVQSKNIGEGTTVWQFAIVLPGAVIGQDCNINSHSFIGNDVVVGNHVTIKSGTTAYGGIRIEDDVFIGPEVIFATDFRPDISNSINSPLIVIKKGASLGSGTTVLPGITIGNYAITGPGSIITGDVPDYAMVYGNPAQWHAWVNESGEKLQEAEPGFWIAEDGSRFKETGNTIVRV